MNEPHPGNGNRPPAAAAPARRRRGWNAMDLSLIAVFAALMAASVAIPGINVGALGVPITLQTLVVSLCGLVLGFSRGTAAVSLYVLLGLIGLPIFSGFRAGPAVLASPSAGYIIGFIFGAAVVGALATLAVRSRWRVAGLFGAALAGGLVIHVFGIAGFMVRGMGLQVAVLTDLAYIPGDIIKNVIAVAIALSLHRAFPDLLVRRRK
ncbi:biotin transport system substrate-specific component [Arthrobacter stackebrandtii]|uniref:Biotin transporter n=1 Tax=Arthrobacter stackebrandtii TaxID=272161 RepID=A0ABS4Z170_9MICC|nr:biotin transporter BioY [Arthrobacter stackebrandtii]MBP2414585.1 biotin transport system substrate-specific component [Arthrobacter stackebrandtii]PYH01692.1 BioY family transporter [Arthrobacter stackebrandtii]